MWKASAGAKINLNSQPEGDDDWETDPDFINDVNEQEQRWGSTTIEGSGRTAGAIDMGKLRKETEEADANKKKKDLDEGPKSSFGYGGKFGVEKDRMDQSAVGHDYTPKLEKHVSQKDYSTGFGGKYGVQTDRVDKSAVSWDHKEKVEKHASQKDYSSGFGGKFGVQSDRQDKSAVGWDHVEKVDKHESQKDYSKGFGGKFGVQSDRQDKSAVGWDHHEKPQKHESQTDHKVGFGGKFGVQTDRMDKSAVTFNDEPEKVGTTYAKVKPDIGHAKPSDLRAKFENMSSSEDSKPPSAASSPAPRKTVQNRAALFNQKPEEQPQAQQKSEPKQLDQSKTAFLTQTSTEPGVPQEKQAPKQLDQSKLQFNSTVESTSTTNTASGIKAELEELKQIQQQKEEHIIENDQIYGNIPETVENVQEISNEEQVAGEVSQEDEIVDTGLTAVALYDYAAGAEDEISFDPEDVVTHIEMIDEGWWRGMCKGKYGLFPANYVQLQQ